MIKPTSKVPELKLDLVNNTKWDLHDQKSGKYTLLIFYRGYHCPKCKQQLENVQDQLDEIRERDINLIAISMDSEDRAKKSFDKWNVEGIPIGYGLSEEKAREWGLFISESISEKEPKIFSEPGMFLVKKDGTLFMSSVQSMPFARPKLKDILAAVDFIEKEDYPPRGTH